MHCRQNDRVRVRRDRLTRTGLCGILVMMAIWMSVTVVRVRSADVPAGLQSVFARRARAASAAWGPSSMENAGANYTWQPETLMYKDTLTGHEVWRLSCTNNQDNIYHDDIAWPQWSADGAWLAFASSRDTKAFAKTGASTSLWMLVHTDGSHLMPIVNGSNRSYDSGHPYFHWSPQVPNVYYDTGGNAHGLSLQPYDVYQNQVSDTGVSRTLLFTTNQGGGNTKAKILSKTISGDGLKILLRDQYVASGPYYLYPCTVYPPSSARCDNPPGYTMDRGQGNYYGDMPTSFNKEHGGSLFLTGNSVNGYFVYLIPDGTGVHWRMAMTGSAADGGPLYTAPGTSGEVLIMSTGGGPGNVAPWPNNWFWSHPRLIGGLRTYCSIMQGTIMPQGSLI